MSDHGIVLFDGECAFCNGAVRFICRRDPEGYFRFASLQSNVGADLLAQHGFHGSPDTVVLIDGCRAYSGSDAPLRIARRLPWPWPLVSALCVIPRFLRDPVYFAVARRRYRWFGRSRTCVLASPELRGRCLEQPPAEMGCAG